jgi:hypothetical protein
VLVARLMGSEPISIKAYPGVSQAPANVILTIHIDRTDENRQLSVACESADHYVSSDITLEGANSKAQWVMDKFLRSLPPGHYECVAGLFRTTGQHTAKTQFEVQ